MRRCADISFVSALASGSARLYGLLSSRLTPGLRHAQHVYVDRLFEHIPGRRWLDVGCGHCLIPRWMPQRCAEEAALVASAREAVGADPCADSLARHATLKHKVLASAEALPFADASFDLVTANMVMEHLPDPLRSLREIARVLRPGGRLIAHTPNFDYPLMRLLPMMPQSLKDALASLMEGRAGGDVFPTFYRFNRCRDIEPACRNAGFASVQIDTIESAPITWRLGPLAAGELAMMRLLRQPSLVRRRANLIVQAIK